ncbi:MAG: hypothetical protein AB4426_12445 [Xenococcaceae cyanobacterium]
MRETATRSVNLKDLEQLLQKRLQSEPLQTVPLQIRCFFIEQNLIILVHHPKPVILYLQQVFLLLRQTLDDEQISGNYQVLMYLIVHGQEQPALPTLTINSQGRDIAEEINAAAAAFGGKIPELEADLSLDEKFGFEVNEFPDRREKRKTPNSWWPVIAAGTGISLGMFFSSFYALTRPCVIRECQAIPQAQHLAQKSAKILEQPQSAREILAAQQQLIESMEILQSIPTWSSYRPEAENLLKAYGERLESLEEMIGILQIGGKAASIAQNPPFPVSKWSEIRKLWREAIARLEQLPADSELYSFAQTKIQEYQRNLATIDWRLKAERKATTSLKAAKQAAKIAKMRQNAALSLSNWQLVHATWQTTLKRLKEIPQGTTASEEAQRLLESYMPKLVAAKTRKNQEELAANIYNQATRQAQLAKNSESINQWSAAVSHWRNALIYIEQMPKNSFQYTQALPLIISYTKALEKAQAQLKVAVKLQQVRSDLEKTCSGGTKICDYTINDNAIKVHLTPVYMQQVRHTALYAKAEGNLQTQMQLLDHISTLEQSLQAISNNTGIPMEVYNSDGVVIITYEPSR